MTSPNTNAAQTARATIERIITGDLSQRGQGFMLVLPQGYQLEGLTDEILAGSYGYSAHPDIRRLLPEGAGNQIKVEAVRDALPFLASSPAAGGMKTLVIYRAHTMNESAANALLKPLEEPTASTRILILTDRPGELPVTIRSRCSVHNIRPDTDVALQEMESLLGEDAPKIKTTLKDALAVADGNPGLAADMIRFKLVAWTKKVSEWMNGNEATPPLPPLSGKTGAPLPAIAMSLQSMLLRRCRGELSSGLSGTAALEAAWHVVAGLDDIDRAGIDAKTRLHSLLVGARKALK